MGGWLVLIAVVMPCLVVEVGDVLRVAHGIIEHDCAVLAVIYGHLREVSRKRGKLLLGDEVSHNPSTCQTRALSALIVWCSVHFQSHGLTVHQGLQDGG